MFARTASPKYTSQTSHDKPEASSRVGVGSVRLIRHLEPTIMEGFTYSEWEAFIHEKALESESDLCAGPLSSIMSPLDDRFPLALDHTLLKQNATPSEIDILCDEAIKFGFKVNLYLSQTS